MQPWLSFVGIGEDGYDGLGLAAREKLRQARWVFGGKRHLALVSPLDARATEWKSPFHESIPLVLAKRNENVCILASGDPFYYGVGSVFAKILHRHEYKSYPQPSAFSLAANALGWSQQDCCCLSLHGRSLEKLLPVFAPAARLLVLSSDGSTPARVARILQVYGWNESMMHIGERLGGPHERWLNSKADDFQLDGIDPLNIIAVELVQSKTSRFLGLTPGLGENWFIHDGQITKSDVRAITLGALRPFPGALLWDIGAGSGSIAVEFLLRSPQNHAIAFEQNRQRIENICANRHLFGLDNLEIVAGRAPEVLKDLRRPDAIFVGGGVGQEGLLDQTFALLKAGGRMVVNSVTIEGQTSILRAQQLWGGEIIEINIARSKSIGRFHAFHSALGIVQWRVDKPWE